MYRVLEDASAAVPLALPRPATSYVSQKVLITHWIGVLVNNNVQTKPLYKNMQYRVLRKFNGQIHTEFAQARWMHAGTHHAWRYRMATVGAAAK